MPRIRETLFDRQGVLPEDALGESGGEPVCRLSCREIRRRSGRLCADRTGARERPYRPYPVGEKRGTAQFLGAVIPGAAPAGAELEDGVEMPVLAHFQILCIAVRGRYRNRVVDRINMPARRGPTKHG